MFQKNLLTLGLLYLLVLCGCGSDLKLKVNTAEEVRHTPAADLTRKVEVTYRDAGGSERYRQSVAVTGLGQPIDMNTDSLNGLEWDKDGHWEAKALDGDGGLLLYGSTQVDPDQSDAVEINISRMAALTSKNGANAPADSILLRAIRTQGFGTNEKISATDLRAAQIQGKCLAMQTIRLDLSVAGEHLEPSLVFETNIRGGAVSYALSKEGVRANVPVNAAGESVLELTSIVRENMKSKSSGKIPFYIYTNEYEGCVDVSYSVISLAAPRIVFEKGPSAGRADPNSDGNTGMSAYITLENPNPFPVSAEFSCEFENTGSKRTYFIANSSGHNNFASLYDECRQHDPSKILERTEAANAAGSARIAVCAYQEQAQDSSVRVSFKNFKVLCHGSIVNDAGVRAQAVEATYSF